MYTMSITLMKKNVEEFLKGQYGNRVDHPQPLLRTDTNALHAQREEVKKKITYHKKMGWIQLLLGLVLGVGNFLSFHETSDYKYVFVAATGLIMITIGVCFFIQIAELRQKILILDTLLLLNEKEPSSDSSVHIDYI
jgi:hypothetical protein